MASTSEQSVPTTSAPAHAGPKRGTWVVVALLLLGVAAGSIAVVYWQGVIERTDWSGTEGTSPTKGAAAPGDGAPLDQPDAEAEKADKELRILGSQFQAVAGGDRATIKPSLDAADRFVQRYPDYGPGYTHRALIHADLAQYAKSRADLERSLALDANQPEAHALAGDLSYNLESFDAAVKHFEKAISLAPEEPRFIVKLAKVHIERGELDTARTLLDKAMNMDSAVHEAHAAMSDLLLREGHHTAAIESIDHALEQVPLSNRRVFVNYTRRKATILRLAGQPDDALLVLDGLFEKEQQDLEVIDEIAESLSMLGKPDRAAETYEKAMTQNPLTWEYALEAARWRMQAGEPYIAERHLRLVRQLAPNEPALAELEAELSKGQSLD